MMASFMRRCSARVTMAALPVRRGQPLEQGDARARPRRPPPRARWAGAAGDRRRARPDRPAGAPGSRPAPPPGSPRRPPRARTAAPNSTGASIPVSVATTTCARSSTSRSARSSSRRASASSSRARRSASRASLKRPGPRFSRRLRASRRSASASSTSPSAMRADSCPSTRASSVRSSSAGHDPRRVAHPHAVQARRDQPLEQVVGGQVGRRGGEHLLAAGHGAPDHLDEHGGLPRPGRPVHERQVERAVGEVERRLLLRRQGPGKGRPPGPGEEAGRLAREHRHASASRRPTRPGAAPPRAAPT